MKTRTPRLLFAIGAILTVISGSLLSFAVATSIGPGGPYGFLTGLYPLCLLPGAVLLLATILLYSRTASERFVGIFGLIGAVTSIPLAFAGFWVGFVLVVAGALLMISRSPAGVTSGKGAAEGATGSGSGSSRPLNTARWIAPALTLLVGLVAILLICPQTVGASFVSTVDLVNDPVTYDLQAVDVFGSGGNTLSYQVNAVSQASNCPQGYAYLVNGYTNDSGQVYWFQVGLSYDWGGGTFSYSGWGLTYEVFGPNGGSIYPTTPGAGIASFSGPINSGDPVDLALEVGSSGVSFTGADASTHARASETFSGSGFSAFGGDIPPQFTGFFTGVMTECYRSIPLGTGLTSVTYQDQGSGQSQGGVFVDEIDYSWGRLPYLPAVELPPVHSAWTTFLLSSPTTFQAYGLSLLYNSTAFVTESS